MPFIAKLAFRSAADAWAKVRFSKPDIVGHFRTWSFDGEVIDQQRAFCSITTHHPSTHCQRSPRPQAGPTARNIRALCPFPERCALAPPGAQHVFRKPRLRSAARKKTLHAADLVRRARCAPEGANAQLRVYANVLGQQRHCRTRLRPRSISLSCSPAAR